MKEIVFCGDAMEEYLSKEKKNSIANAIRSVYQLIVLVEEESRNCNIIDCNNELSNLKIGETSTFEDLYESLYRNTHPENRDSLQIFSSIDLLNDLLSKQVYVSVDCLIRHSDYRYYWSRITVCNSKSMDSTDGSEYLILIQDIHDDKSATLAEHNELIRMLSAMKKNYDDLFIENMTDAQTGCYNRKGFRYFEAIALEDARENGKDIFVCVVDLNGLKHLNDTFGHGAGDTALCAVADALKAASPDGSYIIRTGGDEFLVFCPLDGQGEDPKRRDTSAKTARSSDFDGKADLHESANENKAVDGFGEKLKAALDAYNNSCDNPFEVSASYGYVVQPVAEDLRSLDSYIETADEKMYVMKELTDPYKR